MQKVEELSNGTVRMAAGTLYGAIENLLKLGFLEPVMSTDPRRKVYVTSVLGKETLRLDYNRMKHMTNITKDLI